MDAAGSVFSDNDDGATDGGGIEDDNVCCSPLPGEG